MTTKQLTIIDAIPTDIYGIRKVQKITWIATYPNKNFGITKQDIESRYTDDETESGRQEMEKRRQRLMDPDTHTWVAKVKEEIVGFCLAQDQRQQKRLGAIYVLPAYQGQGIGQKLMTAALSWLGHDHDIYVNVVTYNQPAIDFYQRCGFVKTGKKVIDQAAILPSGKILPEIEMIRRAKSGN